MVKVKTESFLTLDSDVSTGQMEVVMAESHNDGGCRISKVNNSNITKFIEFFLIIKIQNSFEARE